MGNKKMRAFIFGLIPMTLMQCLYWNWLIHGITDKGIGSVYLLFIAPVIATLIYVAYERFIVYSVIYQDVTFRDRIPLAVLWILESIIAEIISGNTIWRYDQQIGRLIAFGSAFSLLSAIGMIVWFPIFRLILYWGIKNEN